MCGGYTNEHYFSGREPDSARSDIEALNQAADQNGMSRLGLDVVRLASIPVDDHYHLVAAFGPDKIDAESVKLIEVANWAQLKTVRYLQGLYGEARTYRDDGSTATLEEIVQETIAEQERFATEGMYVTATYCPKSGHQVSISTVLGDKLDEEFERIIDHLSALADQLAGDDDEPVNFN